VTVPAAIEVFVAIRTRNLLAGRLYPHYRRGSESASFIYDDKYLAAPEAYELDPGLPLVSGTLQTAVGQPLFGAFADSSPDRWGRTLIHRAERARAQSTATAQRSISETDLLLGVRDDLRQGSLRFRYDGQEEFQAPEESGVPVLTDLPVLLDIAARAERDTADYGDLKRLRRAGSSLGGARPKAHTLDNSGRVAIAKFPSENSDTWDVMAWEKVALDLARHADLIVPDSQLIRVGDRHVLIVDRFDRDGHTRIGYASAMTMLEARDGDQRSYLEIAEIIEQRSSAATVELGQLWRRIAFNILISNTDDHLRNHGFLHRDRDVWELSPAFDLNPNPNPGPKYLSTRIDFDSTLASVDTLMSVAPYFRLDDDEALLILAQVARAVARWPQVARSHGLLQRDLDVMESAFEHTESSRAQNLLRSTGARKDRG
jgi:serine/threonine-protein kinase HipA